MENGISCNTSYFLLNITNNPEKSESPLSSLPTWTIVRVTVCRIGIFANSLVIFVIIHGPLWKSVFMSLLMTLATYDSLYLVAIVNIQTGIFGRFGIGPWTLHCSLNNFLLHTGSLVSSRVTILISLEKIIAIYYPFIVHIFCTKIRMNGTTMALTIMAFLGSIPYIYISSVTCSNHGPECQILLKNALVMTHTCIFYTLYSILPFLIIAVFNRLIIRKVKAFRLRSQVQQCNQESSDNDNSLIVRMVSICFFCSNHFTCQYYSDCKVFTVFL